MPAKLTIQHNLPQAMTPFVERPAEIKEIAEALDHEATRLVTLVGLGGTGKTRLALHYGSTYQEDYPDGVYWIPLVNITTPERLFLAIFEALAISTPAEDRLGVLVQTLKNKRALFIFDNFEHLVAHGVLVGELLSQTNHIKILVTSQMPLNVWGETLIDLGGMAFPQSSTDPQLAEAYPALRLFEQSARRVNNQFAVREQLAATTTICQLLDGLPLAIELVADWLRVLSPNQIVDQLQSDLALLNPMMQHPIPRHRSFNATFDYVWQLLDVDAQRALMQLAVFKGQMPQDMALRLPHVDMPILHQLMTMRLVEARADEQIELHSLIRYGAEQKASQYKLDGDLYQAYYELCLQIANEINEIGLRMQEYISLEDERFFVSHWEQALAWATEHGHTSIAPLTLALGSYWRRHGYWGAAHELAILGLAIEPAALPLTVKILLLHIRADSLWHNGHVADAYTAVDEAMALAYHLEKPNYIAKSLLERALIIWRTGEYAQLTEVIAECLAICQQVPLKGIEADAYYYLAMLEMTNQNYVVAARHFEKIATDPATLGQQYSALINLAAIYIYQNDYHRAYEYAKAAMVSTTSERKRLSAMINLSHCEIKLGYYADAEEHCQTIITTAEETQNFFYLHGGKHNMALVKLAQGDYVVAEAYLLDVLHYYWQIRNKSYLFQGMLDCIQLANLTHDAELQAILTGFLRHYVTSEAFPMPKSLEEQFIAYEQSTDPTQQALGATLSMEEIFERLAMAWQVPEI